MTRIRTAFIILVSVLVLCTFSSFKIHSEMKKFIGITEEIEYQIKLDNTDNALQLAENMIHEWDSTFRKLNPVIRYDELLSVYDSIVRLYPLIENECDDVLSETAGIKFSLQKIAENELPRIF